MKSINLVILFLLLSVNLIYGQWSMSNDSEFNTEIEEPEFDLGKGPKILLDGGHHNFFVKWNFIEPFSELAVADGYRTVIDSLEFTPDYLSKYDIVMVIHALPFDFTTKTEVTTESTFTSEEINSLYNWVQNGGSLIVFSEHAPFDQAINPLLKKFNIKSSIGTIVDTLNYDKSIGRTGWIKYNNENGLLDKNHPILKGRNEKEKINRILTFGGSALSGEDYSNLFRLSETAENTKHKTGVGPIGSGNSQCLAGQVGKGKIIALGDSNGFAAMLFHEKDGSKQPAGMNLNNYDWRQFVLNTLHWLSNETK